MDNGTLDNCSPAVFWLDYLRPWSYFLLDSGFQIMALTKSADQNHGSHVVSRHRNLFLHKTDDVHHDGVENLRLHLFLGHRVSIALDSKTGINFDRQRLPLGRKALFKLLSVSDSGLETD